MVRGKPSTAKPYIACRATMLPHPSEMRNHARCYSPASQRTCCCRWCWLPAGGRCDPAAPAMLPCSPQAAPPPQPPLPLLAGHLQSMLQGHRLETFVNRKLCVDMRVWRSMADQCIRPGSGQKVQHACREAAWKGTRPADAKKGEHRVAHSNGHWQEQVMQSTCLDVASMCRPARYCAACSGAGGWPST